MQKRLDAYHEGQRVVGEKTKEKEADEEDDTDESDGDGTDDEGEEEAGQEQPQVIPARPLYRPRRAERLVA